MEILWLFVSVPVAGFRIAHAREYWETYPCPPPATVYGMLLSLVGETDRLAHAGAELAIALVSEPARSVILRTLWRVKSGSSGLGVGMNKRPDYQELLSDIRLSVWVRQGADAQAPVPLVDRIAGALIRPGSVTRYGGLSLGESTMLVDEVRSWRDTDRPQGRLLLRDPNGNLSLPVWPDHVGSIGTRWDQFRLAPPREIDSSPPREAWTALQPPEAKGDV